MWNCFLATALIFSSSQDKEKMKNKFIRCYQQKSSSCLIQSGNLEMAWRTGVDVPDVWTGAIGEFVPGPVSVHEGGVRSEVCAPEGGFTWRTWGKEDIKHGNV